MKKGSAPTLWNSPKGEWSDFFNSVSVDTSFRENVQKASDNVKVKDVDSRVEKFRQKVSADTRKLILD